MTVSGRGVAEVTTTMPKRSLSDPALAVDSSNDHQINHRSCWAHQGFHSRQQLQQIQFETKKFHIFAQSRNAWSKVWIKHSLTLCFREKGCCWIYQQIPHNISCLPNSHSVTSEELMLNIFCLNISWWPYVRMIHCLASAKPWLSKKSPRLGPKPCTSQAFFLSVWYVVKSLSIHQKIR